MPWWPSSLGHYYTAREVHSSNLSSAEIFLRKFLIRFNRFSYLRQHTWTSTPGIGNTQGESFSIEVYGTGPSKWFYSECFQSKRWLIYNKHEKRGGPTPPSLPSIRGVRASLTEVGFKVSKNVFNR